MRKATGILLCALVAATIVLSCAQPYDMTKVLGGKTLTYSRGPDRTETYVFAKNGESGTYSIENSTYKYPDAASEGDYTKKAWVKTGGWRASFTYDPETYVIVYTQTHQYSKIPGATTSYRSDYTEYAILDYEKALNPDTTAVTKTRTGKILFNQDAVTSAYILSGTNEWTYSNSYTQVTTVGSDVYTYSDLWTEKYTITDDAIKSSASSDRSDLKNGTLMAEWHDIGGKLYPVYAVYELGDTKEGKTFAELWKKDKAVTFRVNQTNETYKEWEGATPPTAPSVDAITGIGEAGTRGDDPLNYYLIDNNTYGQTAMTFQHYGTFMTWFASSANRSLE